jgi:3-oxoacyl-[acyl-carrier protein] reductase
VPQRAVLVTGAARGLAKGIARVLAERGDRVAITYRPDGTSPDATLADLRAAGATDAFAIAADNGVAGETARSVREAEARLGRLDVLVHAVGPIVVKRFADSTLDDHHAMVAGNLTSAVEAAFAALPGMRERKFGRLIFFGMNGSDVTNPALKMSLYSAAKAGVVAFARALSLEEAANGITVNVIEPGDIRDKTLDRAAAKAVPANNPTGHAGSWEDIAYAVRMLVAEEASFLNGAVLRVSGGLVEPYE